eukprot:TRINITY_DN5201_c0_g1_i2.p1 TRINITY_DN5201_c0_g1~~TRINITY_DN5201_c0_g1_i2.p1  ORF type:complete len:1185 (+),score=306.38 TRINITY_DN5201_c0_g1_i2:227-3556(+)
MAAGDAAYVVSVSARNSTDCPGGCRPIEHVVECQNAAAWLRLGMDSEPSACPSLEELVGAEGLWRAEYVGSAATGDLSGAWLHRLGGCSWRSTQLRRLSFNAGDIVADRWASISVAASPFGDWLVCRCAALQDLPPFVAVTSGAECPNHARDVSAGRAPHCGVLTSEGECEAAAAAMPLPDRLLSSCSAGDCPRVVDPKERADSRPAGCHYRMSEEDAQLAFNPHYNASAPAPAKPPGSGAVPDLLLCGCGAAVAGTTHQQDHATCGWVGSRGLSVACGHSQTCNPESSAGGIRCMCVYSREPGGDAVAAVGGPADCQEAYPVKFVLQPHGAACAYDAASECVSPPTRERCEQAAVALGLSELDGRASLRGPGDGPRGCYYAAGEGRDRLRWRPGGGDGGAASVSTWLLCECRQYPIHAVRSADCAAGSLPCRDPRDAAGCAEAAIPSAATGWSGGTCTVLDAAGPGLRVCDCSDGGLMAVVAQRFGFGYAGGGDCSSGPSPGVCAAGDPDCVVRQTDGVSVRRSSRYTCIGLDEWRCRADVGVCRWEGGGCTWADDSFAAQSEIPATFHECLEHCLLLVDCSAVSFFSNAGAGAGVIGGCDFFRGAVVGGTGETVKVGKGAGEWHCWKNNAGPQPPATGSPTGAAAPPPPPTAAPAGAAPPPPPSTAPTGAAPPPPPTAAPTGAAAPPPPPSAAPTGAAPPPPPSAAPTGAAPPPPPSAAPTGAAPPPPPSAAPSAPAPPPPPSAAPTAPAPPPPLPTAAPSRAAAPLPTLAPSAQTPTPTTQTGPPTASPAGSPTASPAAPTASPAGSAPPTIQPSAAPQPAAPPPSASPSPRPPTPQPSAAPSASPRTRTVPPESPPPSAPPSASPRSGTVPPPSAAPSPATPAPTARCPVKVSVVPALPITCSTFDDDTPAFSTRNHTYCSKVPPAFSGGHHFAFPHCFDSGVQVTVTCPNDWAACDLFALVYHCAGCSANSTHSVNGGWATNLPLFDWVPSSCAPRFCTADAGQPVVQHPMVSFYKQASGGDRVTLPDSATQPSMYFSLVVKEGRVCAEAELEAECTGLCAWNATLSECRPQWCPRQAPKQVPPTQQQCASECAHGAPHGDCDS